MGYRGREERSGSISAECRGYELRDSEGEKVGKVDEVFVGENDRPEYLGTKTGLLGNKLTLIPADLARADDERRLVEISESKDRVKDAPSLGSDEEITSEHEKKIRDHFGLDSGSSEGDDRRDRAGDAEGSSPGYRGGSGEAEETRSSDRDRQSGEGSATDRREPWSDSGDDPESGRRRDERAGESAGAAGAAGGAAAGRGGRGTGAAGETGEAREAGERRQSRRGESTDESGSRETVRVSVWREKARAERVLGDDGSEEVRIRKEWVEEEEMVEVEGGSRGDRGTEGQPR